MIKQFYSWEALSFRLVSFADGYALDLRSCAGLNIASSSKNFVPANFSRHLRNALENDDRSQSLCQDSFQFCNFLSMQTARATKDTMLLHRKADKCVVFQCHEVRTLFGLFALEICHSPLFTRIKYVDRYFCYIIPMSIVSDDWKAHIQLRRLLFLLPFKCVRN